MIALGMLGVALLVFAAIGTIRYARLEMTHDPLPVPRPHSTLLRRGVLLCERSVPERVVHVPESGICPVHNNGSCPMWFVPWADAERAAKEAGQ